MVPGGVLCSGPMSDAGFFLSDSQHWVELRPLSKRWAEVVRGSLWAPGDWVERPRWIDWKEAVEITHEGHSVLSPAHLSLVYDALADAFLFRSPSPDVSPRRPSRHLAPPMDVEPFVWEIYVATA